MRLQVVLAPSACHPAGGCAIREQVVLALATCPLPGACAKRLHVVLAAAVAAGHLQRPAGAWRQTPRTCWFKETFFPQYPVTLTHVVSVSVTKLTFVPDFVGPEEH